MYQLLIVDDEETVVDGLADTVPWETIGIETVHRAYSGHQALELVDAYAIDIVITDIRMPGISGVELIGRIRERSPRTKTILLSGHSEFEYAQEGLRQHASDYLLKPIRFDDLLASVARAIDRIREEWEDVVSHRRALDALRQHLPLLRADLLNELLQGRRFAAESLTEKLRMLEVELAAGDAVSLLLVRLEEPFAGSDPGSLSLFQYAIVNMAEEIFAGEFMLWAAKERHDYLVFLAKGVAPCGQPGESLRERERLENLAAQLQKSVNSYLKGTISIVASPWGAFPDDVATLYESSVAALRRRLGAESELFATWKEQHGADEGVHSLRLLYEPPLLQHLLEAGRWSTAEEKLEAIFEELEARFSDSLEHLLEAYYSIASVLSYIAHKNGRRLETVIAREFDLFAESGGLRSIGRLREWTRTSIERIRADMEHEVKETRTSVVQQVHEYIERHLTGDVSLQAIAGHVHLHPVYLSRVYKLETGESLSDYLYRFRMNTAAHLLKGTDDKIYEIAERLGYAHPPYFIKVFKKEFGMTPQEYRDGK
ncbi:response regulator transcription factor [Paenibacillus antri]|uniref:Response regulator transcription factor n=1 Tax=Paenibacillus antri TaxID=2582848 RepID=A0A5R9FX24_9BACL|nr:response regulator [Paenibacillus antri]TLS48547.1 response regulator transcription factor [Paenibacillus antri]